MLHIRVGVSLDNLFHLETYRPQTARHVIRIIKEKINANLVASPLVQVNGVTTNVEGQ